MGSDLVTDKDGNTRILRERALKLAVEESAASESGKFDVLEFMLDREKYGIESIYVREVSPVKSFTKIPCTPSFVTGVINIRGKIISIIDLGIFFDLPRKGLSDLNKVIIIQSPDMEFGILADEIIGVSKSALNYLETSLPTLEDIRSDYLKGVTNERLIILDALKILTDPKLIVNDKF